MDEQDERSGVERDQELWDLAGEMADAVSLVGRLSLLGFMRELGAVSGLRHFAQTYGIRLKDKTVSVAKLIHRVTRELGSAESVVHKAMAQTVATEYGGSDFPRALSRLGITTIPELGLSVYARRCLSMISSNVEEAVAVRVAQSEGEVTLEEAVLAVHILSLMERYLADSSLVEALVDMERAARAERERERLEAEIKRLRRLAQEQRDELRDLKKARRRADKVPERQEPSRDRDELRALRRENHDLRRHVEEMERERAPKPRPDEPAKEESPREAGVAPPPLAEPDPAVVRDKRVLVVGGDSKEDVYRDIVEGLGGAFTFLPGFNARPIDRDDVARFHGVIFVSTQLRHAVFDRVKGHAKALGIPFRIVTFKGNEAFTTALIECLTPSGGPG